MKIKSRRKLAKVCITSPHAVVIGKLVQLTLNCLIGFECILRDVKAFKIADSDVLARRRGIVLIIGILYSNWNGLYQDCN